MCIRDRYRSLEELCRMERETGKPFWKIVQEDDCVEQGISAEESLSLIHI